MFLGLGPVFLLVFWTRRFKVGVHTALLPLSLSPPSNGFVKINFVVATFRQNGDAGLWAAIRYSSVYF